MQGNFINYDQCRIKTMEVRIKSHSVRSRVTSMANLVTKLFFPQITSAFSPSIYNSGNVLPPSIEGGLCHKPVQASVQLTLSHYAMTNVFTHIVTLLNVETGNYRSTYKVKRW